MRIKADLRALTDSQPITTLTDKVFAGVSSAVVVSAVDFATDDYVLIGILGLDSTEIRKITVSGTTFTFSSPLTFDHPQDTQITKIAYNQIAFFYSSTLTGSLTQLGSFVNITPDSFYTYYDDTAHTTGYGWFQFYNSNGGGAYSSLSNAVPYAGFDENSVKNMLDAFFTAIGNRERKMIKEVDVIRWLNEAYAIARNRLNLSNRAYNVPTPATLSIISGTQEYDLPSAFSKVRTVNKSDGQPISFINLDDMPNYTNTYVPAGGTLEVKYYLRNSKIGFTPIPSATASYFLYYQTSSPVLSSYIDYIELPANNFYFLLDYLLYRAAPLTGGNAANYLQAFNTGLNNLIISAHVQDNEKSSIGIGWSSVV